MTGHTESDSSLTHNWKVTKQINEQTNKTPTQEQCSKVVIIEHFIQAFQPQAHVNF